MSLPLVAPSTHIISHKMTIIRAVYLSFDVAALAAEKHPYTVLSSYFQVLLVFAEFLDQVRLPHASHSPPVAFDPLGLTPDPTPRADPQYSSRSTSYSATVPDLPSAALASHGLPGQSSTHATATSRVLLPTSWRPSCPRPRGTPAQSSRLISLCRGWRRATASS